MPKQSTREIPLIVNLL